MIKNVIRNKGGLHNRLTQRLRLMPFTLRETELYFSSRNIILDRYQVLQLYLVMGGIPQYLREVRKGESSTQAIDRICFSKEGFLFGEFDNLFSSLFEAGGNHLDVIRALTGKPTGLIRNEIISESRLSSGGRASATITELEESGFISSVIPHKKNSSSAVFRLSDEFSLFYLKYVEHSRFLGPGSWFKISRESSWKSWSGYAFESICLKHTDQIRKALDIAGVLALISTWRYRPADKSGTGAQIDLLIDRQDNCINICEIKFSTGEFIIDKKYALELNNKLATFRSISRTRKTLFLTMITAVGVKNNEYRTIIQNELTMNDLFDY